MELSVEPGESRRSEFVSVVARTEPGGRSLGYAQAVRRPRGWSLEVVLDPRPPAPAEPVRAELIRAALAAATAHGAEEVTLWEPRPTPEHDAAAEAAGLTAIRDLLQMRRPLPAGAEWSVEVRPFVAGRDEDAWLTVNNRAFAEHPEQGAWDRAALEEVLAEPWFDPGGFLLHEVDGELAGFCWTKVHPDERPPLGEIFVIAVDPAFGGRGLGRELTLAGLDHLCERGLTVGMLYVDASNRRALKMYEDLGFVVDHIHRGYSRPAAA
ncbi:MAG TPA: mycothiol synthase [Acidimicrobiales bacterium]|nr:mycothiol synthase [Acidimicrobiales bacterium]